MKCLKRPTTFYLLFTLLQVSLIFSAAAQKAAPPAAIADSVTTVASLQYAHPSFLRKLMMGANYRQEWETPVRLPVFGITALGLQIQKLGGGKQTKSLKLIDKDGVEWALRTVDKEVSLAVPPILRRTFARSVVQDMVSAAHPYAPLTIPTLAAATGVTVTHPRYFFVPDDTALGPYREIFANTVCMLEKRDVVADLDTDGVEKMLRKLLKDHKTGQDQEAFLKARLLDMLIADWDRHSDQWKWGKVKNGGKTTYVALPKDRDQAFFYSDGWLLKFIRLFTMKFTVGLTPKTTNLVKLNSIVLPLDRFLLNELDRDDWQRLTLQFVEQLPDSTIVQAIRQLPPPIYAIRGTALTNKLIQRKNALAQNILRYYQKVAREVTVYGTDASEHFSLVGNRDSLVLTVSTIGGEPLYRRTFLPAETKKLYLLGLDGDDVFSVEEGLQTTIVVQIDGGKGNNQYSTGRQRIIAVQNSGMDANTYVEQLRAPLRIRE